jgi:hypothetical protein
VNTIGDVSMTVCHLILSLPLAFLLGELALAEDDPAGSARDPQLFGPLPVLSVDSLSLLFLQPAAEKADTLEEGRWSTSFDLQYSSLQNRDMDRRFTLERDSEILRWSFTARHGLTDRLELKLVLPFHYATSGFLDEFIDDFHDITGLGPTGRVTNRFVDTLEHRGETFLNFPETQIALADVTAGLKLAWLKDGPDPLGVSFRVAAQLPTGSRSDSFGSGGLDGEIGVIFQKTVWRLTAYAALSATFQDTPRKFRRAGVNVRPVTGAASGSLEWRIFDWLALVTQIDFAQNLIASTNLPQLDRQRLLWSVGFIAALGERVRLRLGITEDAVSGPVADVQFLAGLDVRW